MKVQTLPTAQAKARTNGRPNVDCLAGRVICCCFLVIIFCSCECRSHLLFVSRWIEVSVVRHTMRILRLHVHLVFVCYFAIAYFVAGLVLALYDTHTNGQRICVLRSVGTGSEDLTISPWLQVAFLLTSAHQHCVVLLFVACLPFLRNVRRCRAANASVGGSAVPARVRDIHTVGSKRVRISDTFHSFPCARYVPRMQSLSVSNRHAPLPGLFLGSPTGARHLGLSVVPVRDRGL